MAELFARYLTPLTWLLWAVIVVGMVDHLVVEFLPRRFADWTLLIMWPLLAAVWFGHRHKKRVAAAQAMASYDSDGA